MGFKMSKMYSNDKLQKEYSNSSHHGYVIVYNFLISVGKLIFLDNRINIVKYESFINK